MRCSRFLLLVLLSFSHSSAYCADSPVRTVERFYAWAMRPALGEDPARVRELLGQELFVAIEAQRAYEKTCVPLAPGTDKPYMLDQSLFFYGAERATSVVSTRAVVEGDIAHVLTKLAYYNDRWADTVVLRRKGDRWIILDIKWQDGESLTQRLVEFAGHPSVCAVEPRPGEGSN